MLKQLYRKIVPLNSQPNILGMALVKCIAVMCCAVLSGDAGCHVVGDRYLGRLAL